MISYRRPKFLAVGLACACASAVVQAQQQPEDQQPQEQQLKDQQPQDQKVQDQQLQDQPQLQHQQQLERKQPPELEQQQLEPQDQQQPQGLPSMKGEEQRGGKQSGAKQATGAEKSAAEGRGQIVNADVNDVVERPDDYIGKTVKLRGQVDELLNPHAFTLDETSMTATQDLLVIAPKAAPALGDDSDVTVTGQVVRYVREQFERDYGAVGMQPDLMIQYQSRPVLVAQSIRSKQGRELLPRTANASPEQGGQAANAGRAQQAIELTPAQIARDGSSYYGRRVEVKGEIDDTFKGGLFALGAGTAAASQPEVMVIPSGAASSITEGANVRVEGTLRSLSAAELHGEFASLHLDRSTLQALENRPVIVADSVTRASDTGPTDNAPGNRQGSGQGQVPGSMPPPR